MKKSVIVLIFLIYLASIVFINIFGMKILSHDEQVYATSIECINEDMKPHSSGEYKWVMLDYVEGLTYTIEHRVYPENATNSKATYIYDTDNPSLSINKNGVCTFSNITSSDVFTVTLKTSDGTNKSTVIKFIIMKY